MALGRREFLRRSTALAAATWGAGVWRPAVAAAQARTRAIAVAPELTTLGVTLAPAGAGPYLRLIAAPGWPIEVRDELADPRSGREDRRVPLATIAHLTDVHVIDAQSTARVEFLDRYADPPTDPIPFSSAWRAQETLTAHVGEAMVQRIRAIGVGPVTGRPMDVAVSTGDNTDNQQSNELEWFITLLNGGNLAANSGAADRYEGVQDAEATTFDDHYWHPEDVVHPVTGQPDRFKRDHGFPTVPGLLAAAIVPFAATGLPVPWYSCYGNHDGLLQGNAPSNPAFEAIATGPLKIVGLPAGLSPNDLAEGLASGDPAVVGALAAGPTRPVTADERRAIIAPSDYVRAHLEATGGPGPTGHGYSQRNLDTGELYYTFTVAPGILGISLDTVNRGGYADGSIGQAQLDWLEGQLAAVHGRYFDDAGNEVRTGNDDQLVILFSHHNIPTLVNRVPDPAMPTDERLQGDAVEAFLHRFPNVIAWVNGHSHVNRVWARPDTSGRTGGFWEINTAAHVDAPQQSRIVEVVDNRDGTLSLFGTLVDHAGPATPPDDPATVLDLAAWSRELAVNDPQWDLADALGAPTDRNVELLIRRPFDAGAGVIPAPSPSPSPAPTPTPSAPSTGPSLPATGGGMGAAAAAVVGAWALRRRSRPPDDGE